MSPIEMISSSTTLIDGTDIQRTSSPQPKSTAQDGKPNVSLISQASTIKYAYYDHISYSNFEPMVKELCSHLWPDPQDKATKKRPSKRKRQQLSRALRKQQLLLPPQRTDAPKEILLEHLRGGSYNRVVGITIIEQDDSESRMVLRVPRGMSEPEHDVTILQFLEKWVDVPIPEVVAYDFTLSNPLKAPYILQERIPGLDLESKTRSYPDLTHEQKKQFLEQFCQILVNMRFIEHPYAGKIESRVNDEGEKEFTVGPFLDPFEPEELVAKRAARMPFFKTRIFEIEDVWDAESISTEQSETLEKIERPDHQTPFFFLMTQFGR